MLTRTLPFALILLAMLASAPVPAAYGPCPASATAGPDVEAVRQREWRGARANVEGWSIDEARAFFAPDFVSIAPDGSSSELDRVFAGFRDGRSAAWARSFDLTALDIRVYDCTTAVVVGVAQVRALAASAEAPPWRIRFLNVWRRMDGEWRYAASQFTRMAQ